MKFFINKKIFLLSCSILFALIFSGKTAEAATLSKPVSNLGMVGYWSFNEGTSTKATDFSGNSNTGTLNNMAFPSTATSGWNPGKRGNGLVFDGTDDYVNVPDSTSLNISGTVSISAWVKAPNSNQNLCFVSKRVSSSPFTMYSLCVSGADSFGNSSGKKIYFLMMESNSGNYRGSYTTADVVDGNWHHIVAVSDASGASLTIYVDGVSVALTNDHSGGSWPNTNNSQPLTIGFNNGSGYFNGPIDEVRIYNRALTASEVRLLYGAGSRIINRKIATNSGLLAYWPLDDGSGTKAGDTSGNGITGTLINSPTWTTSGKHGNALSFTAASSQYVDISTLTFIPTTAVTLSAWIKLTGTPGAFDAMIIGKATICANSNTDFPIKLTVNASRQATFYGDGGGDFSHDTTLNSSALSLNTWYHVTATFQKDDFARLYINGVQVASAAVAYTFSNTTAPWRLGGITIGSGCGDGSYFPGSIDDVRVYNRALNSTEVATLANTHSTKINAPQNTKSTNGLVGLWSFNGQDISGTTATDRAGSNNGTLTNGPLVTNGQVGQALKFDGSSSYVSVKSGKVDTSDRGTISGWIYVDNFSNGDTNQKILSYGAGDSTTLGCEIRQNAAWSNTWRLSVVQQSQGDTADGVGGSTDLSVGQWYFVACISNGSQYTLYLNGAAETSNVWIGSNTGDWFSDTVTGSGGANTTEIGSTLYAGSRGAYFRGKLDEIRVYNRALSAAEVKQLYLMGK
jgi:hypothetical protein